MSAEYPDLDEALAELWLAIKEAIMEEPLVKAFLTKLEVWCGKENGSDR